MKVLKTLVVIIMMTVAMPVFAQFTTGGKSNGISSSENYLHTGYKGMVDAGYGIGVGDFGVDRISSPPPMAISSVHISSQVSVPA